jgi:hypothetical protein
VSSHYIFIKCRECDKESSLYTGEAFVEGFDNGSYELEQILAICDKCEGEQK